MRCFLYDGERGVLHGIFRPDYSPSDPDVVAPYAWTSFPWTGVARPDADHRAKGCPQTRFTAQIKVAPVQAFPPIHVAHLPPGLLTFNATGAPAYALDADQVREIAKSFVKNR